MDQAPRHTEAKPEADLPRPTLDTGHILAHLRDAWHDPRTQRDIANLPRPVFDALRGRRPKPHIAQATAHLDRVLPAWPELAAAAIAAAPTQGVGEDLHRLAALLTHRPLNRPDTLLHALDSLLDHPPVGGTGSQPVRAAPASDPDARLWLLLALSGTDTSALRAAWLNHLRRSIQAEPPTPHRALWFAFLHAFLRGWLTYPDFRDSLTTGRVLTAAHPKGDYRRALRRLGLTSHPVFTKWYRQVLYEVAHQPDVSLSLRDGGWIRDFPGEDYLRDALAELHQEPHSWWPLHVLRWTSGVNPEDERFIERLRESSPLILALLSLLRPDLCRAAGRALGLPENHGASMHEAAINWLTTAGPAVPLDLTWAEETLRPWAEAVGEPIVLAAGALCSVEPPSDFAGPAHPALRCRAFIRSHLLPHFDRLMDNLCCVHALRKQHFDLIAQQARKGRPAAARALALWPEKAEESAPTLFRLTRQGSRPVRQAAREALDLLAARSGAADLHRLEKRVDLASAWADAGLEGRPARVWWNVAGYHIKLSVAAGSVTLQVLSGGRRLAGIPKAVRQDPQYPEIRETRAQLARGYRYFRRRFEEAMVEQVTYPGSEFAILLANPMVRSLVSRLALLVDGAPFHWTPSDPLGDCQPPQQIQQAARVAIAHPLDLSRARCLSDWQQRVIDARIPQPLKQVFREVYVLGENERGAISCSRFSDHALIARRAFALLRSRGYAPRTGDAVKEWPSHGLRAHIRWAHPHEDAGRLLSQTTAADPVTSGPVRFETEASEPLPLGDVHPIVFSETLRDADLLVSRAPAGELGFTSKETLRLRSTLIRYLARALGLTTVYVSEDHTHAIVEGRRAMYRIHLGSGSVLLENSRRHLDLAAISIAPLEALVTESADSVTARILDFVAALSRDDEIADPHFLDQLTP